MSDDLRDRAVALLAAARARVTGPTRAAIDRGVRRLRDPMSVAVAGHIKAGKSTLVNALLGTEVVGTGLVETTFNVTRLTHGLPTAWVRYKDSARPDRQRPARDLLAMADRSVWPLDELTAIRVIEVSHPAPLLRTFTVIDLPGLNSAHKVDSANTREFLVRSPPAAVLYAFEYAPATTDEQVLADLQGSGLGRTTPLDTVAVVSRVDERYWPQEPDPLAAAAGVIRQWWDRHPPLRQLVHSVHPVCGLLGLAAQTLTDADVCGLTRLADLSSDAIADAARNAEGFLDPDDRSFPLPLPDRERLFDRLGGYGIWKACELIRTGERNRDGLAARLLDASGVETLRRFLAGHFGARSAQLAVARVWSDVQTVCAGDPDPAARLLEANLERFRLGDSGLEDLSVLRLAYAGALRFPAAELNQVLEVLGEFGPSDAARLGVARGTAAGEMAALARRRWEAWRARSSDPMGLTHTERDAARVVARAYATVEARLAALLPKSEPGE
jgi:hypothetical protein